MRPRASKPHEADIDLVEPDLPVLLLASCPSL